MSATFGKCVYCGIREAASREHVIARGFFTRQPANNIVVPTCVPCNSGNGDGIDRPMTMDEEYARTVLCMQATAYDHPVAEDLFNSKVIRSFERAPKFLNMIASPMRRVTAVTKSGVLVPNQTAFPVDLARVERVLRKITKGLFYYTTQTPLPHDHEVEAFANVDPDYVKPMIDAFYQIERIGPFQHGEDGVFRFMAGRPASSPSLTAWVMIFYDRLVAISHTRPRTKAAET